MDSKTKETLTAGWLSQFPSSFSDAFLEEGSLIKIARGKTLYDTGDDHLCLYCVVTGCLRFVITMNEQPPRFTHLVGPGTWFGENELALGTDAILEVTSATDATLFRLTKRQFESLSAQKDVAWRSIAALSSMNVALAIGSVVDLMIRDPRKRLCAVVLRIAGYRNAFQGQSPMDTLFLTQTELSTAANLSRSKTAEITRSLVDAGAVETIYGGLKIVKPEILKSELTINGA